MIDVLLLGDKATLDSIELFIGMAPGFRLLDARAIGGVLPPADLVIADASSTAALAAPGEELRSSVLICVADDPLAAVNAFAAGAIDFLLKPLELRRFSQALRRAAEAVEAMHAKVQLSRMQAQLAGAGSMGVSEAAQDLWIARRGTSIRLAWSDVRWISADGDYVTLHTPMGDHHIRRSIAALAQKLQPEFVRVHRSALVRRALIQRAERLATGARELLLTDGSRVPVGRAYAAGLGLRAHGERSVPMIHDFSAALADPRVAEGRL